MRVDQRKRGESVGEKRFAHWVQSVGGQGLLLLIWGFMCFGLYSPTLFRARAWDALVLCIRQVLPTVFPIAAAVGILTCMAPPPHLLCRPMGRLLRFSDESVGVLFISLVSGFPVGAMLASRLLEVGAIDREEAARLCCVSNNASAAFLVGTAGEGFFHRAKAGWILWISSTLAALCVAALMGRRRDKRGGEICPPSCRRSDRDRLPTPGALARSVASTGMGMLKLSAFVVFFAVFCTFLEEGLELLLPDRPLYRYLKAGCYSFFEITGGLEALSHLPLSNWMCMTLAGVATGFGGLSVYFQCMASGDAPDSLLLFAARWKLALLCGIFSGIFTLLLT